MSKKNETGKKEAEVLKPNFKETPLAPFVHESHRMPKTRRDFISHGFIGLTATAMLPTFASMLALQNEAFGQEAGCALPQFQGGLPYICIDGGGGMNIAGQNVIVGMVAGSEVQEDWGNTSSDFIRLGVAPAEHPLNAGKVEEKYGLKFHRASGILHGMNTALDGQLMPNGKPISDGVDGLIFCTRTADDTATNQINTVYMANKAGAKGQLLELIGNSTTDSGGRSLAPADQVNLTLRPTQVSNNNGATGLLSLGQKLSGNGYLNTGGAGGAEKIQKFMQRMSNMSKSKIEEVASKNSIGQIQQVLNCSFDSAKQLFQVYSSEQLDPANDTAIVNAFQGASENAASVAKLVLDKIAGAGTITVGGCDYHGGAPMGTHNKDMEIGEIIGRIILAAANKAENVCLHLFTDGGVAGDAGGATAPVLTSNGTIEKVMFTGDSGTRSSAVMIVYKHNHDGSSLVRENTNGQPRRMVGNFVKNGGVNLNTVIGNSTQALWQAIMLNYLAAQGREADFDSIFGLASVSEDFRNQVTRFKKITA